MKTPLGDVTLKTGETLEVSCILGPEPSESDRVAPFLGHKGVPWRWQIENALSGPLDDLETRFYVGEIDGRIVANICTFENGGVGIFGHVYTTPEHRHKGAAGGVMGLQMEEFRQRGGKALTLGTGFGSNAYRIYEGNGFRSIEPGSGTMDYSVHPGYFDNVFGSAPVTARPSTWGDWPRLNLLFLAPEGPLLRNLAYRWFGRTNVEGGYIVLQKDRAEGRCDGAWVMETPDRIPVGFASLTPSPRWPGPLRQLDLFIHPRFESGAGTLLDAVERPEGKTIVHTETPSDTLASAMESAGFRVEGRLARHLRIGDDARDIVLWAAESP